MLDDDPYMLELQAIMLRTLGCPTVTATDGESAMAILVGASMQFDLIICDLQMPENDGIDFLQALQSSRFRGQVILVSGESMRVMYTVRVLLSSGPLRVLGAIQKPAGRAALAALIAKWNPEGERTASSPRVPITAEELRWATAQGQWMLHYQPKVHLKTARVVGMEALVRWNHPKHGVLYPECFIDLAEESGAIDEMSRWVLGEAMTQRAAWQEQGLRVQVAVNLSMRNLQKPGIAHQIAAQLRKSGGSSQDFVLEITESRLMTGSPAPLENLLRLRLQGFELSIDDFGTGHSSMKQLRDVPFTELKVDRSFVAGARHDPIILPILECSIAMARRLGMKAVAEGIESEDDWRLLREMGCDFAQGYFISRPLTAHAVIEWLPKWNARVSRLTAA